MVLLSLLSGALLILPVAVTVAVYIGVESQKVFHGGGGKTFQGGSGSGSGGISSKPMTTTYCQKSFGVEPYPKRYTFNPNQWGDPDNTGALCMNITTKGNVSQKEKLAANFSTTWQYPIGPATQPVHAFPNSRLNITTLPIIVSNIDSVDIDVQWSYSLGDDAQNPMDSDAVSDGGLNANVCIDMFLADDRVNSQNTTAAQHEVMVWFGRYGSSTFPVGSDTGVVDIFTIGDLTFDLYFGRNGFGQTVSTWVARGNTTAFKGDVSSLVQRLSTRTGGPSSTTYLGYYAFGTEAYSSKGNVTFSVPKLEMDVSSN